ncbi:MAG: integrase family protein [Planctomycetota bacterium]
MRTRFTEATVRRLSANRSGPTALHFDSETPGLGLRVGTIKASYIFQRKVAERTKRRTIGDADNWNLLEARREARRIAVAIDRGESIDAPKAEPEPTLGEAIEKHIEKLVAKGGSERSVADLREVIRRYTPCLLGRELRGLSSSEVAEAHARISKRSPAQANLWGRHLRAVWNTVANARDWPGRPPTRAIAWNRIPRRREPIPWEALPAWFEEVEKSQHRDLYLVALFTGFRSGDVRTIRWDEIEFEAGTIYRPNPKGGRDRTFTVPVAEIVLSTLAERRRTASAWVFPSGRTGGPIAGVPAHPRLPSLHRLRDTFATAAVEAGVGLFEIKVLMNHALPQSDVTLGYVRPSVEHLRGCVENVADVLTRKAYDCDRHATLVEQGDP